ncbi:MAG: hypothetical protein LBT00_07515 [Spirochaetaceae bacterium]|jgi:hypothetical protein|nr:hypothetical protein [Spirochaetaceae bacterium]
MDNSKRNTSDFFDELTIRCSMDSLFDVSQLRKIYDAGIQAKDARYKRFMEEIEARNDPELVAFYEGTDEWHIQTDIFNQLCIIGVYIDVELFLKTVLKYHFKVASADTFTYKEIKERYRLRKIKLSSLKSFSCFNELRLLNNAIKHNGCVSKDLSKEYPQRWKIGEKIRISEEYINILATEVKNFKHSLYDKISPDFKYK